MVEAACYAVFIQAKSPTNCDIYLIENIFGQTPKKERPDVVHKTADASGAADAAGISHTRLCMKASKMKRDFLRRETRL